MKLAYSKFQKQTGFMYQGKYLCVFEDTQETTPRFYSWKGAWYDQDRAKHSPFFKTFEEAEDWAMPRRIKAKYA
jgi:hypothetical protein